MQVSDCTAHGTGGLRTALPVVVSAASSRENHGPEARVLGQLQVGCGDLNATKAPDFTTELLRKFLSTELWSRLSVVQLRTEMGSGHGGYVAFGLGTVGALHETLEIPDAVAAFEKSPRSSHK